MAAIDVVLVVLYIVGTTLLGAWFTRRQRDVNTYFVGDRDVPAWLVLISIVATETSTVTFLSVQNAVPLADIGVADVGEMRNLGSGADGRVLGLDERAELAVGSQYGAGPQVRVRADRRTGTD